MVSLAQSFSALCLAVLSSIFNPGAQQDVPPPADRPDQPVVEYKCGDIRWVGNTGMQGSNFIGNIEVDCSFKAVNGGGFKELNRYLLDQAVHGPNVKEVHSGPTSETYQGLPSTYFDVTDLLGSGSDNALVRNDEHFATDFSKHYVFGTLSKDIQGQGNAKYLKKTDIIAFIDSTDVKGSYTAKVKANAVLEKPWFLSAGAFENLVRDQVKKQAEGYEKQIITEVANHL